MNTVKECAKAIVAALIAGLSVFSGYLANDTGLGDITAGQWVQVVLAALVALAAVYAIPNKPPAK